MWIYFDIWAIPKPSEMDHFNIVTNADCPAFSRKNLEINMIIKE